MISEHQALSHMFLFLKGLAKPVLEMYWEDRNQGTFKTESSEHHSPEKDQILHCLASLAEFPPCKAETRNKLCHKLCPHTKPEQLL